MTLRSILFSIMTLVQTLKGCGGTILYFCPRSTIVYHVYIYISLFSLLSIYVVYLFPSLLPVGPLLSILDYSFSYLLVGHDNLVLDPRFTDIIYTRLSV